jgi:hypothetical protein
MLYPKLLKCSAEPDKTRGLILCGLWRGMQVLSDKIPGFLENLRQSPREQEKRIFYTHIKMFFL